MASIFCTQLSVCFGVDFLRYTKTSNLSKTVCGVNISKNISYEVVSWCVHVFKTTFSKQASSVPRCRATSPEISEEEKVLGALKPLTFETKMSFLWHQDQQPIQTKRKFFLPKFENPMSSTKLPKHFSKNEQLFISTDQFVRLFCGNVTWQQLSLHP